MQPQAERPVAVAAYGLTVRYPGQSFGAPALNDVTLSVPAGERLLVLGPNGAGKSTLIQVLAGLLRPTVGRAEIYGDAPRRARGTVGVLGHATYLYGELSVQENLRLYARLYGVDDSAVPRAISRFRLDALANVRVDRLSRGQQQRAGLARAAVHEPAVLLLDEPDAGLDPAALDELEAVVAIERRTTVLTTHRIEAGARLATRVAVIARGHLIHSADHLGLSDVASLDALLRDAAHGREPVQ